jgi:hypothetical protein
VGQVIELRGRQMLGKLRPEQGKGNLPVVPELSPEDKDILLARLLLNLRVVLGIDSPAPAEKHKASRVIAVNFERDGDPVEARRPRAKAKRHRAQPPRLQEEPA